MNAIDLPSNCSHYKHSVPAYDVNLWEGKKQKYCVIIPVINEGNRILNLLCRMKSLNTNLIADIIIADGGTTDGSIKQETLKKMNVSGLITTTKSRGLSSQLRCAYSFALSKDYLGVITIDGNNKDDPKEIEIFINELKNGFDFIQASRFIAGGVSTNTPLSRTIAIRCIHAPLLRKYSNFNWTDTTQGFRGYSRALLLNREMAVFREVFQSYELLTYISYRAPKLGFLCKEVASTRSYPAGPTPTKIKGFKGNLSLLRILIKTCMGHYDPD